MVGVERPVAEGRGDRVGPVVAHRCRPLQGDVRSDAESTDIGHHIDEPPVVDVVVQRHADDRIDPALRAAAVRSGKEDWINRNVDLVVLVAQTASGVELHVLDIHRKLVANQRREQDLLLFEPDVAPEKARHPHLRKSSST